MELKPKTDDEIQEIVRSAVEDAVSFVESEIQTDRIKAQKYYDGETRLTPESGTSQIVCTKVRDVVRAVKPSLMRVFLSTTRPVEFVPRSQQEAAAATQATEFIHAEFERLNGFRVLSDAFQDALVKKQGIVKAYWRSYTDAEIFTYTNLTDGEYAMIASEDDVKILEHETETVVALDEFGSEVEQSVHSMKISRESDAGEMVIESVPPEEFFIDEAAKSLDDAYVVAHRTDLRVADLIAMGFDFDEVAGLDGGFEDDVEQEARDGYSDTEDDALDPSMKVVGVTEAYMRVDVDGSGIPMLYKFILGGTNYEMLDYELCDELPFAKFEADPEPHSFYGNSLAELVMNDQDSSTSILRGILNNVALVNAPRTAYLEGRVDPDALESHKIGEIIPVESMDAIQPLVTPFVAGQTLSVLGYVDDMVQSKTGVSRASMGLDANALQANTRVEAQATVQAGAATTESMVRNLAQGVKDLFGLMLRLYQANSDDEHLAKIDERYVGTDPRVWNSNMDMMVNVGLGSGREEEKMVGLQSALQMQMQVFQAYGPSNGVVSMTNIRNTLADMLAINGIRNPDRYFAPMDEEREQQILQQQAQKAAQQQGGSSPEAQAIVEAESIKAKQATEIAQLKGQLEIAKAQLKADTDLIKLTANDDLERDKMAQNLAIENAKLGQDQVNIPALAAAQAAPRDGGFGIE